MRRLLITAVLGGLLLVAVGGFGTVRFMGQDAEHERITRRALTCSGGACFAPLSLDEVAGRKGTWGAVGNPDDPRAGLMSSTAAHCDSGDHLDVAGYPQTAEAAQAKLESCRDWMVANLDKAVSEAARLLDANGRVIAAETALDCSFGPRVAGAKCKTLQAFGTVLHASQDFYSHSNWTDRAKSGAQGTENPPGLANTGAAGWISLRGHTPFPEGLISGCYEGYPERFNCKGRVKHEALNKDTGVIDPVIGAGSSSRGEVNGNFKRAVEAAVADSQDKWMLLQERLVGRYGEAKAAKMICALTKDDPAKACA